VARTIDELAELSGVSRATVSRVLNGGPVSPTTRRRVQAVLEREDYRPNIAARSLASGRSGVIGLAIHVDPHNLFQDPYFGTLLQGITDVLAEHAAGMMLWLGNRSKEETLGRIRSMGLLDGVIATAHDLDDPLVDGLLASSIPTVLIGHRRADRSASYVDIDNVGAADVMTTHMLQSGRRRIGVVTGHRGTVSGEDRLSGYFRAMERAGLSTEGLVVDGDFNREAGGVGACLLLERGVDAIFCANDAAAAGALTAIRAAGRRVPDDVALGGFDDLDFAAQLDPPLTTIRQGVHEQGAEAARVLFQLLQDPDRSPRRVLLPTELVIRRSTIGDARYGIGGGDGA
jgi:DNA-binding LacI/PurR family transcriptional regulator